MRPRIFLAATGLLLTVAAIFFLNRGRQPDPVVQTDAKPSAARTPRDSSSVAPSQPSAPSVVEPTLSPSLEKEIEDAVVTYSPEALPTFEKLLASGEPDIREAARDGLVRLGEKGGAALLRRASARLTDPEEIKKFLETADYLELPSASEGPLKK